MMPGGLAGIAQAQRMDNFFIFLGSAWALLCSELPLFRTSMVHTFCKPHQNDLAYAPNDDPHLAMRMSFI
jgi:hypothetical protein